VRAALSAVWLAGGCAVSGNSDLVKDPSSLLAWCGEELCGWKVEEGSVEQVTTWHEEEFGAALEGDLTALSYEWTPPQTDARCFEVTLTSRRMSFPQLEVSLEPADEELQGLVWSVPHADYMLGMHIFELDSPPQALRIRVTKRGGGEAVLALLTVAELFPLEGC
jgi:hypothetical protein